MEVVIPGVNKLGIACTPFLCASFDGISTVVESFLCGNMHGIRMDYVTVEQVFSQAIPNLFIPGITTSTRGGLVVTEYRSYTARVADPFPYILTLVSCVARLLLLNSKPS